MSSGSVKDTGLDPAHSRRVQIVPRFLVLASAAAQATQAATTGQRRPLCAYNGLRTTGGTRSWEHLASRSSMMAAYKRIRRQAVALVLLEVCAPHVRATVSPF